MPVKDMKKIALLLAILCCLFLTPSAHSRVADDSRVPIVGSHESLRAVVGKMAMNLNSETKLRPAGEFRYIDKAFRELHYYGFFDYATHYYYTWDSDSLEVNFRVTLADNAILYAAHRNHRMRRKLNGKQRRALRAAESCVERAVKPGMTRAEIVRALHDEVAAICTYDRGNIFNQSCVSVLNRKKGACGAYARTLWLLLAMNDIRSFVIQGKENTGGPHAWNLVELEKDKWYHVDVTWDDMVPVSYRYFCLTDDQIKRDHKWDSRFYPKTPKQ